jgi:hypothetical protein
MGDTTGMVNGPAKSGFKTFFADGFAVTTGAMLPPVA